MSKPFWRVWGKFYGYPQCCMDEMSHFYVTNPKGYYGLAVGDRKLDGTGFIPCAKHNKFKTKHLVGLINSNRLCTKEFPYGGGLTQDLDEIIGSNHFKAFEKKLITNQYRDELS